MGFPNRFGGRGVDRGTGRGAKRMLVTPEFQLLDYAQAKANRIDGIHFQSKAEAMRWIALNIYELRAGAIRNLRRQVRYDLHVVRPDGLKEKIGTWTADFVYERKDAVNPGERADACIYEWVEIVEDVKGHAEDLYKWKRLHFQAEYGKQITERGAWAGSGRR